MSALRSLFSNCHTAFDQAAHRPAWGLLSWCACHRNERHRASPSSDEAFLRCGHSGVKLGAVASQMASHDDIHDTDHFETIISAPSVMIWMYTCRNTIKWLSLCAILSERIGFNLPASMSAHLFTPYRGNLIISFNEWHARHTSHLSNKIYLNDNISPISHLFAVWRRSIIMK